MPPRNLAVSLNYCNTVYLCGGETSGASRCFGFVELAFCGADRHWGDVVLCCQCHNSATLLEVVLQCCCYVVDTRVLAPERCCYVAPFCADRPWSHKDPLHQLVWTSPSLVAQKQSTPSASFRHHRHHRHPAAIGRTNIL